ncbi:MAG TPA: 50S ribosomal protein L23 [bacterium]|nr:50S ribosomal protein L23 [bacterium]
MDTQILKSAVVSEKSFQVASSGKFTFIVDKRASKDDISATLNSLYNVDVISVNTANFKGKIKRSKKGEGKRSDFKKATVTLKKGQKIDLFEVEKEDKKAEGKDRKKKSSEKS